MTDLHGSRWRTLADLWLRRDEPRSNDVPMALHVARRIVASGAEASAIERSLICDTVEAMHTRLGWPMPNDGSLATCHGAATSVHYAASLVTEQVASALPNLDRPPLILGDLGLARSAFGAWDAFPVRGAAVAILDGDATQQAQLPPGVCWGHHGVRMGHAPAGPWIDPPSWETTTLGGREVYVLRPEMAAAILSATAADNDDPGAWLAVACAMQRIDSDQPLDHLDAAADAVGTRTATRHAITVLGLEDDFGIEPPASARLLRSARQLFRLALQRAHLW
jgi:hypothetical protein